MFLTKGFLNQVYCLWSERRHGVISYNGMIEFSVGLEEGFHGRMMNRPRTTTVRGKQDAKNISNLMSKSEITSQDSLGGLGG